jgi:hypothetical protein
MSSDVVYADENEHAGEREKSCPRPRQQIIGDKLTMLFRRILKKPKIARTAIVILS